MISTYHPEDCKLKIVREQFYESLQEPQKWNSIMTIILGDLNARVANNEVQGIKQRFNKNIHNDNRDLFTKLCTNKRINNMFLDL